MLSKILDILVSIINFFVNRNKTKQIEKAQVFYDKQEKVDFKSEIESVAKKAESSDPQEKADAIEAMRKLISE